MPKRPAQVAGWSLAGCVAQLKRQFPGDMRSTFSLEKRHKIPQQTSWFPEPEPEAAADAEVVLQRLFQWLHWGPPIGQG